MPNLDLNTYSEQMKTLTVAMTDERVGGRRVQRTSSTTRASVVLSVDGVTKITAIIAESSLYVKGFSNAQGSFYFKGDNGGKNELKFGCNYSDPNGLGILSGGSNEGKTSRARKDIVNALDTLSQFAGGNDLALKVPLAIVAHYVSEAIRFTTIYHVFVNVMKRGATFTFADLQCYTQYWEDLSSDKPVTGAVADSVYTYHH